MQIVDRVFAVTGASSGIGLATARALVEAGGRVVLVARRAERLAEEADRLGAAAVASAVELTTADAPDLILASGLSAFGRVDGLLNCAGRGLVGKLLELDVDLLDEALELNLVAPLRLIQRLGPELASRGDGVVVNVLSPTARMGLPGIAGYAASKAAFAAVTDSLRRELLPKGVLVIAVYPGATESEFYDSPMGAGPDAVNETRPPTRPARLVAEAIVRAIGTGRREVWCMSGAERRQFGLLGLMNRLAPKTIDRSLSPSS
jgi:short-subunit dehydrogenase